MRIEFQYIGDDFPLAVRDDGWPRLSAQGRLSSKIDYSSAPSLSLFAAGALLMVGSSLFMGWFIHPFWFAPALMVGFLAYATVAALRQRSAGSGFANGLFNQALIAVEIDETSFRFIAPRYRCALEWSSLSALDETKESFLIADRDRKVFVVPKRAFGEQTTEAAFRDFISSHIAPAPSIE